MIETQLVYIVRSVWRLLMILKAILTLEDNSPVIYIIEQWSVVEFPSKKFVTTTTFYFAAEQESIYKKKNRLA